MSQTHSNYINGVPVKISEKYKPPIKIQINQSLSQRLANVNSDIGQILATNYDTTLEKNVLMKLSEWQRVRQQENCDRKERVRCRQQEQQRHIEQKQKQMLTAVSYPSADDLLSDDEAEDSNESARTKKSYAGNESKPKIVSSTPGHFSPPNHFDNILIPTVIPEQLMNNRTTNALAPKFNKINYSDFENDTSSPFDNVELKTMNDLDILAQVLNITTKVADDKVKRAQNEDYNRKETVADFRGTHHSQHRDFSVQQQQPMTNSYYDQSQMNRNTSNYVSQSYSNEQHILPIRSITHQLTKYSNAINSSKTAKNDYVYHNGNEKCSPEQQLYQNNNVNIRNYNQGPNNKLTFQTQQSETQNKSKSVPDIVQELNNELKNSERKRIRNNSQSSVNTTSDEDSKIMEPNSMNNRTTRSDQTENADQLLRNLSASSQKLAKSISLMGFPLERVSKITEKFGKDDKRIIEHLIPLSELLDLGFDENKISEALIKFNNDKEKALDYLIS